MAQEKTPMICSKCGVAMNHHADKLVFPVNPEAAKKVDPALGGLIEETHGCPGCGCIESRRAS